jgi:hypothetical protein
MSFAHGERHLAISSSIMMGKRHDDLFGHICIYRRKWKSINAPTHQPSRRLLILQPSTINLPCNPTNGGKDCQIYVQQGRRMYPLCSGGQCVEACNNTNNCLVLIFNVITVVVEAIDVSPEYHQAINVQFLRQVQFVMPQEVFLLLFFVMPQEVFLLWFFKCACFHNLAQTA